MQEWIQEPNSTAEGTEAASYLDDGTLLRFVIAREFDIDAALSMLKDAVCWKRDIGLDDLMKEWRGLDGSQSYDSFCGPHQPESTTMGATSARANLAKSFFYAGTLNGASCKLDGGPILVERLGIIDLSGLYYDEEAQDLCVKSYSVYLEEAWRAVRVATQKDPRQNVRAVIIIDLAGVSLSHLWYKSLISKLSHIGLSYYPEVSRRIYMVNVPGVFQVVWSAVSVILPQRVKDKVKVLGSNF